MSRDTKGRKEDEAMTRRQAISWVRAHDDMDGLDDDELDAVCKALGYDPNDLRGDAGDPIDRRWDVVCAAVPS